MSDASQPKPGSAPVDDTATALVTAAIPGLLGALGATVDPGLAAEISAAVEAIRLPAGDTLFAAGEPPDAAYFVVTGRLAIVIGTDDDETTIRTVGAGEIIGEIGLLDGSARTATVRADRDAILARLPRRVFDDLANRQPDFLLAVSRVVVERLAHPRPALDTVGTVAIAVTHPDGSAFTGRLHAAMGVIGPTARVSATMLDERIGVPGAARSGPADPRAFRIGQALDGLEAEHRFVLLEADPDPTPWSAMALRHADRVLIVTSDRPDAAEEGRIRSLAALPGPAGRHGKWIVPVREGDADHPHGGAAVAAAFGAERVVNLRAGTDGDVARLARLATGTGIGLVLGGGGARGFAHIGVYRAMHELGIPVDAVAGASIGGIFAATIARGYHPDELQRISADGFSKVLDYTVPVVSMVKGARITRQIEKVFGGFDIEDLLLPFLCVATNLTTSRPVVHERGPVTPAIRSGLAIPGVIPPVPHDGDLLVDGGVLDNLPIARLRSTGLVDTVIAVDVAPLLGPRARHDFGMSVSGWKALRSKLGRRRSTYPAISALLIRSMLVGSMQERDAQVKAGAADLYLDLDLRGVSLLAFDEVDRVAAMGYELAHTRLESWLADRPARS